VLKFNDDIFMKFFYESLDALVLLDLEANKFLFFNDRVLDLYEYTRDEFKFITPYDLTAELNTNLKMENKQESILTKGYDKFFTKHKTKKGDILDMYVKSKKIEYENRLLLFITLIHIDDEKFIPKNIDKKYKPFVWDMKYKILIKNNSYVKLTNNEKKVICVLIKNIDQVSSYSFILQKEELSHLTKSALISIIKRIRKKTSKNFIETVHLSGYKIDSKLCNIENNIG